MINLHENMFIYYEDIKFVGSFSKYVFLSLSNATLEL